MTAMTPEMGPTHNRGEASKRRPSTKAEEIDGQRSSARPDGGGCSALSQFTVSSAERQTGYRSSDAATESVQEPAKGRRVREDEEQGPRLAHDCRARAEDRMARACAAR